MGIRPRTGIEGCRSVASRWNTRIPVHHGVAVDARVRMAPTGKRTFGPEAWPGRRPYRRPAPTEMRPPAEMRSAAAREVAAAEMAPPEMATATTEVGTPATEGVATTDRTPPASRHGLAAVSAA